MVYGCDRAWWDHRRGLPEYKGIKACWRGNDMPGRPEFLRIDIKRAGKHEFTYDLVLDEGPLTVGGGGNSGFQAMNLAINWGATRIILVGFDMADTNNLHWYGRNNWPMANNPNYKTMQRWREGFAQNVGVLQRLGIEVINTNKYSALKSFSFQTLEEIFEPAI